MDSWLEVVPEKYGNREEAIKKLNQVCNLKLRSSEISEMKKGKRHVPECCYYLMINDVLLTELDKAGVNWDVCNLSSEHYKNLIDAITPVQRWQK